MTKTAILPEAPDGAKSYAPLFPIVLWAIDQGCEFDAGTINAPFFATPNGDRCYLKGALKMSEIEDAFDLPENIVIGAPNPNCLWDKTSNSIICIERV